MNMISASEIRETAATLLRDAIRQVSDPSVEPVRFFFDGREWQSQDNVAVGVAPRYSVAAGAAALWRLAPQCLSSCWVRACGFFHLSRWRKASPFPVRFFRRMASFSD